MTETAHRLITADEFARMPDPEDGSRQELVKGVIETMPPPRFNHGLFQGNVYFAIRTYLQSHPTGRVTVESGLQTDNDPDTVRGPDVAYWSFERVPAGVPVETYPESVADLVAEILSPNEKYGRIQTKVAEYLNSGVRMVWVVDPETRRVTVYRPDRPMTVRAEGDELSGEDVLPGFGCRVGELF